MLNLTNWDMQCPNCGNTEQFRVYVKTSAILTSAGCEIDTSADIEYDDGSDCECEVCYHDGIIEDFRLSRRPNPEDLVV